MSRSVFFFPGDIGAKTTSIVTQCILSHGVATTGPGGQSKQAVQERSSQCWLYKEITITNNFFFFFSIEIPRTCFKSIFIGWKADWVCCPVRFVGRVQPGLQLTLFNYSADQLNQLLQWADLSLRLRSLSSETGLSSTSEYQLQTLLTSAF